MDNQKSMNQSNAGAPRRELKESGYLGDQRGLFVITTGLILLTLFAFTALGVEVGRWYIIQAEISKAVDAAALVGAKNLSNPLLADFGTTNEALMEDVANANFNTGFMGSNGTLFDYVPDPDAEAEGIVKVGGETSIYNQIARVLEADPRVQSGSYEQMLVTSTGMAQQRDVEIMLVLDKSGSMSGTPMTALKDAATAFLDFFEKTQENDKFGLVTFASGVTVDFNLDYNFVDPMTTAINAMSASGGTNSEDAIDRADVDDDILDQHGFTDQTGVPGEDLVKQYMIFFSDGNPTAFRNDFTRDGQDYDAVGYAYSSDIKLMKHDEQYTYWNVQQYKTGDGKTTGSTLCKSGDPLTGYSNTKWHVLEDLTYGVNGYSAFGDVYYTDLLDTTDPEKCNISKSKMRNYVEAINMQMAIDHAQELKDKGIQIYTVGFGSVNTSFMGAIASGPAFEYFALTESQLKELFQKIATNIKLRLVK